MNKMHSTISRGEWSGCISVFRGFYDTHPSGEVVGDWAELGDCIAPKNGPAVTENKDDAPYFVPCGLQIAPLTGKTLERAQLRKLPLEGKQRSSRHVTPSNILKFDLDGMTGEQWNGIKTTLDDSGIAYLAYSTHSYGREDKPGFRVRALIPIDAALAQERYEQAWSGAASILFPSIVSAETADGKPILDHSARKIHQQQGTWATSSERAAKAFRYTGGRFIASADFLISSAPGKSVPRPSYLGVISLNADLLLLPDAERIAAALAWIDPDDYETWTRTGLYLKALARHLGERRAFGLWHTYSLRGRSAGDGAETKWASFAPSMPADAAAGTLLGMARDAVVEILEAERGKASLSERGREAALYLRANHPRAFEELRGKRYG